MSNPSETLLQVDGMTCMSCVSHVTRALQSLSGVSGVKVVSREGRVRVLHDGDAVDSAEMIEAVREAGYECALAA